MRRDSIQPPGGGRAPGWNAGLVVARRQDGEVAGTAGVEGAPQCREREWFPSDGKGRLLIAQRRSEQIAPCGWPSSSTAATPAPSGVEVSEFQDGTPLGDPRRIDRRGRVLLDPAGCTLRRLIGAGLVLTRRHRPAAVLGAEGGVQ